MTPQEKQQKTDEIFKLAIARLQREAGFDPDEDSLFITYSSRPINMEVHFGDATTTGLALNTFMRRHPDMASVIFASVMCYLEHEATDELRMSVLRNILDMVVEKEEKEPGMKVKVVGFDQMPKEMKKVIGEALTDELGLKPRIKDIKSSDN